MNEYPTGRFLRDAKLYEIGAGTSEIRRIILGRSFNEMFKQNTSTDFLQVVYLCMYYYCTCKEQLQLF